MKKNGFTLPATTFFVFAFLSIPLIFWGLASIGSKDNVRGATTQITTKDNKGFLAKVNASSGTWDLNVYLCQSKEDCLKAPTSGKRISSISGGKVEGALIPINYEDSWEKYSIVKIFVKSGWGFGSGSYKILNANELVYGDMNIIKNSSEEYQVILINVADTSNKTVGPFIFSDK